MTRFKTLIFLLLVNVSLSEEEDCFRRAPVICEVEKLLPKEYPHAPEDLKRDCSVVQQLILCYVELLETCEGYESHIVDFRKLYKFIEESCNEESPLFQTIAGKLDCIAPVANSVRGDCADMSEENLEKLFAQLEPFFDRGLYRCVDYAWDTTCASVIIGLQCGSELKEPVIEIMENTNPRINCSDEFVAELAPFMEALELVIIEEQNLRNAINDDKE